MLTAAMTPCECHRDLSENGLYALAIDPSARLKHEAGGNYNAKKE